MKPVKEKKRALYMNEIPNIKWRQY